MTLPAIVFSFFVATLFGSLLHVWRGGSLFRLALYLLLSWAGFFGGHWLAEVFSLSFLDLGTIHLGAAILGSLVTLGIGYWLSQIDFENT